MAGRSPSAGNSFSNPLPSRSSREDGRELLERLREESFTVEQAVGRHRTEQAVKDPAMEVAPEKNPEHEIHGPERER
jgi:hypothetical protein